MATEPMFWSGQNCICPEGIAKTGYQSGDNPAAEHENYFRRQTYLCIKELQSYLFNQADSVQFEKDASGDLYYLDENGERMTGEVTIDGLPFYFAPDGVLRTGWQTVFGKRYYYNPENGNLVLKWVTYNENSYYVTLLEGKLVNQCRTIDGEAYNFDAEGIATASASE